MEINHGLTLSTTGLAFGRTWFSTRGWGGFPRTLFFGLGNDYVVGRARGLGFRIFLFILIGWRILLATRIITFPAILSFRVTRIRYWDNYTRNSNNGLPCWVTASLRIAGRGWRVIWKVMGRRRWRWGCSCGCRGRVVWVIRRWGCSCACSRRWMRIEVVVWWWSRGCGGCSNGWKVMRKIWVEMVWWGWGCGSCCWCWIVMRWWGRILSWWRSWRIMEIMKGWRLRGFLGRRGWMWIVDIMCRLIQRWWRIMRIVWLGLRRVAPMVVPYCGTRKVEIYK